LNKDGRANLGFDVQIVMKLSPLICKAGCMTIAPITFAQVVLHVEFGLKKMIFLKCALSALLIKKELSMKRNASIIVPITTQG
jgi:hypothetical protein